MKFSTMFRLNCSYILPQQNISTVRLLTNMKTLDWTARGFWCCSGQKALFEVRVYNPIASRYRNKPLSKCCTINENEKKNQYNDRVLQVVHGSFTRLVMTPNGGFGGECARFYSKLVERIAEKRKQPYSIISSLIKKKVIVSLLRSIGLCLSGLRSIRKNENVVKSIENDAVLSKGLTKIAF